MLCSAPPFKSVELLSRLGFGLRLCGAKRTSQKRNSWLPLSLFLIFTSRMKKAGAGVCFEFSFEEEHRGYALQI